MTDYKISNLKTEQQTKIKLKQEKKESNVKETTEYAYNVGYRKRSNIHIIGVPKARGEIGQKQYLERQ